MTSKSKATKTTWDFAGYWNTVIGATMSADDAVRGLDIGALDTWLSDAECEAWRVGGEGGYLPEEWAAHHTRALADLALAARDNR